MDLAEAVRKVEEFRRKYAAYDKADDEVEVVILAAAKRELERQVKMNESPPPPRLVNVSPTACSVCGASDRGPGPCSECRDNFQREAREAES